MFTFLAIYHTDFTSVYNLRNPENELRIQRKIHASVTLFLWNVVELTDMPTIRYNKKIA
jgi:hypothetical protein